MLPLCSCLKVSAGADLPCTAKFGESADQTVSSMSVSQFSKWCAADPYAYSNLTNNYGFHMSSLPNAVTLTELSNGSISVDVAVLIPRSTEGDTFPAVGFSGSCHDAGIPYRAAHSGRRLQLQLKCLTGGVCRARTVLSFTPNATALRSIVIFDSATWLLAELPAPPKFLCATLLSLSDDLEAQASLFESVEEHPHAMHAAHRVTVVTFCVLVTAIAAIVTVWHARRLSQRAAGRPSISLSEILAALPGNDYSSDEDDGDVDSRRSAYSPIS